MSLRQRLGPVVGTGVVGALWLVHGKSLVVYLRNHI